MWCKSNLQLGKTDFAWIFQKNIRNGQFRKSHYNEKRRNNVAIRCSMFNMYAIPLLQRTLSLPTPFNSTPSFETHTYFLRPLPHRWRIVWANQKASFPTFDLDNPLWTKHKVGKKTTISWLRDLLETQGHHHPYLIWATLFGFVVIETTPLKSYWPTERNATLLEIDQPPGKLFQCLWLLKHW